MIALCKGCACETEADDGICPECYSPAHRIFGPRIAELEVAVRRGVSCIEKLVPYVMWDGLDGESDEAKVQTTLALMRETVTR